MVRQPSKRAGLNVYILAVQVEHVGASGGLVVVLVADRRKIDARVRFFGIPKAGPPVE